MSTLLAIDLAKSVIINRASNPVLSNGNSSSTIEHHIKKMQHPILTLTTSVSFNHVRKFLIW